MAHGLPSPGGPPPLGPEGFDWTAWSADPVVVSGLALLGGAYLAATLWRRRLDPDARVEPVRAVWTVGQDPADEMPDAPLDGGENVPADNG